ncbi:MAG: YybS family protein [Desulfobacterales bacterium]|nr:YybS family protein [Desulfobacterales bacterium]
MLQAAQGDIIKEIVKGVALTGLIFAISIQLPLIGFFFALMLPLPIIFYRIKLGRHIGTIVPAVVLLVIWVAISEATFDTLFFSGLILMGFVLSECIGLNLGIEKSILYSAGSVVGSGFIVLAFYGNLSDTNIMALVSDHVAKSLDMTIQMYEGMGIEEEAIGKISESIAMFQYILVRIIPAMVVSLTLFVTWINLLIARPLLTKRHLFFPDFGTLNLWKAPEPLVWGVIVCGLLLFMPAKMVKLTGLNGLIVFMTVYFFQGIAIVSFYFEKKQFSRFLKIFLYTFIAMQQMLLLFVISLGFFDTWLNFRKLETAEKVN